MGVWQIGDGARREIEGGPSWVRAPRRQRAMEAMDTILEQGELEGQKAAGSDEEQCSSLIDDVEGATHVVSGSSKQKGDSGDAKRGGLSLTEIIPPSPVGRSVSPHTAIHASEDKPSGASVTGDAVANTA